MVQHKIYWQNGEEDQYRLTPQVKIAYLLASFRIIQIVVLARTLVQVLPRAVPPHFKSNMEIGRLKDRNTEVGNTEHRIYRH